MSRRWLKGRFDARRFKRGYLQNHAVYTAGIRVSTYEGRDNVTYLNFHITYCKARLHANILAHSAR
jgi:hypothetical protein